MRRNQFRRTIRYIFTVALVVPVLVSFGQSVAFADNPPVRCEGYGDLQSFSLTVWEAGLSPWSVSTHHTKPNFDTPNWAVVGSLPDSRTGLAAFVADQNNGDCAAEDKSGALTLTSPTIVIPGSTQVPRISINHWFDIEFGWDGGNLKISVNGGNFNLIPPSAIEFGSYTATLFEPVQDGFPYNTNPLANQVAYTGTAGGQPTGSWGETHINLLGIADAGDNVRLRFDFGVDQCGGRIGWYVDEVEFYGCEAELLPSDCGNRVIDPGEQCDDGNDFIGDGCSNTCQIEEDWQCTAPNPPSVIPDHSFEAGTPNPSWTEVSSNPIGTPICEAAVCGVGGGTGPSDGLFWAWFGGTKQLHESSVSQSMVIPSTEKELTFDLEIPTCDSSSDYVEVLIDNNREMLIDGSHPLCGIDAYSTQSVDISGYADGGVHEIKFHSETFAVNGKVSNFFIDFVELPGTVSECRRIGTNLTLLNTVNNDAGGTAQAADWTLAASGPSGFSGPGPTVLSGYDFLPGTYNLSENGPAGYNTGDWVCEGGSQVDGDTITLELNEAATCSITSDDIAPTIKVVKTITNNNGGTINDPNAFGLRVDGGSVLNNAITATDAGDHTVSEDGLSGYQAGTWGGDCAPDGSITLALGQDAICTISNDDISPTLTVVNTIINDDGGVRSNPDAFGLRVDGLSVLDSETNNYDVGNYAVSQLGLSGYLAGTWAGDCNPDGTITLVLGQDAICIITNNDISPTLKVVKTIINDNGGVVNDPNAFGLKVDDGSVLHDAVNEFSAGPHNVSEDGLGGYLPGIWGGDCAPSGAITLSLAENATCTITNNDTNDTSLTLVKQVITNNGGNASASAWTLHATGPTPFSGLGPNVFSPPGFAAGTYNLTESGGPGGYAASNWVCVGGTQVDGDTIMLALGQAAICTITNDDIPGRLKVIKTITNDDGGTVSNQNAFSLRVDGLSVLHDEVNTFDAGEHVVSEDGQFGYMPGAWGGDCEPDGTVLIALDQDFECTITNDDIPPTLKVIKTIINDNGGAVIDENAFGLKVDNEPVLHDVASVYSTGIHSVSEVGLPGYQASTWGGDCNSNGNVNLSIGETAVCTITNDDISPTITVEKTIINNNGGTVTDENAFGLRVNGGSVLHGIANEFDAGTAHTVSEAGLGGYQPGTWGGDCDTGGNVTLALNQHATCTITNDDSDSTSLTLIKQVIIDDGGTASGSSWTLTATGPSTFSGPGPNVSSEPGFVAGTYDLSQTAGPAGYTTSSWVCAGGTQDDGDTITLAFGETATCTTTSDDISPTLKVVKTILNDNNGTVTDHDAFGLRVDGNSVLHNVVNNIKAGTHQVSEDGLPGYLQGSWGGNCDANGNITLALEQVATCTITNDDIAPTLTLVNTVINDNNGTVTDPNAFGLLVGAVAVNDSVTNTFNVDSYIASATGVTGYQASVWGGDCAPDGSITLTQGQDATCTISHDDIPPTLKVVKTIFNDNGGTVTNPNFFGLRVDGGSVLDSAVNTFNAGPHLVSEDGLDGYEPDISGWGGDCESDGSITLVQGQNAVCTITNDDTDSTSLTLEKVVITDNGGEALASDWILTATGTSTFSGNGPLVSNDPGFVAGTYDLSESIDPGSLTDPAGYSASTWICDGGMQTDGDTIILEHGDVVTCTITNDDISPTITILKSIIRDDGGTETNPNAFGLRVDGFNVLHGATNNFDAGPHTVSEDGLDQYQAGDWGTDCDTDGSITLELGQNATCTITNNDKPPTITVVITITNNNGGTRSNPDVFGLMVDSEAVLDSVANEFAAGAHTVSQTGLGTYQAGAWGGDCAPDGSIMLAIGQSATCTITNDDISPTLKVIKTVTNDNGGTVTDPDAFGLRVDEGSVLDSVVNEFDAGDHMVSELGLPEYAAGSWGGACASDGSITLALDQDATCTVTNDDISPTLTIVNNIVTDNGGTETDPDAFGLEVDGGTVSDSVPNDFDAGLHSVFAAGLAGYEAGVWSGDCAPDGSITLAVGDTATCTITHDDISPTLKIVKTIINNNGGKVTDENAFGLKVNGTGVLHNVANDFNAGASLTVSEDGLDDYQAGVWGGDCVPAGPNGTITLSLAQNAICTITNDDIPPTITVLKTINNDDGGTVTDPNDFDLQVDGVIVDEGVPYDDSGNLSAGNHTVSELGLAGYKPGVWGGDCGEDGNITLAINQDAICDITNTFSSVTSLTLVKRVINDDGGSALGSEWTLTATDPGGINPDLSGSGPVVSSGAGFVEGTYDLSEGDGPTGYSTTGTWVCVGGSMDDTDTITLAIGDVATCTITNDDIRPKLTVVKNISGGAETNPDAFGLLVDGQSVLDGAEGEFSAGNHTVSELGLANYKPGIWGTDCDPDGNIMLEPGQDAVCTITNTFTDITSLTLVKQVINNDGDNASGSDWTLTATDPGGINPQLTGIGPVVSSSSGFADGVYDLSESGGPSDYLASDWVCVGGTQLDGDTISLAPGEGATCTITNDDTDSTSLTLVKKVINDNGGNAAASDWLLTAVGPTGFSGSGPVVNSGFGFTQGDYVLSENGPGGYLAGSWICNDVPLAGNTVSIAENDHVTCIITNSDISAKLTVENYLPNNNGGTALPDDFNLTVDGGEVLDGIQNEFDVGAHSVSQTPLTGYSAGSWGGDCASDGSITLALGEVATCSITNDDISPTITVVKTVFNNNGGTVSDPNAFGLNVNGGIVLDSVANPFDAGVVHTVSELGLPYYEASVWGADCATDGTITLALAEDATCTISNDDQDATSLTLVKQVINLDGGSAVPVDWILTAVGPKGFSGNGPSVSNNTNFSAGTYVLSESIDPGSLIDPAGYSASNWVCTGTGTQLDGNTISLALGDVATCTITNDDITPTLTVFKNITNDSGGTETNENAFGLKVDDGNVLHGVTNAFDAGPHTVSELGLPGYQAGSWSGACAADGSVTLELAQQASCTITNNDISPTITVVNTVTSDNGGTVNDPDAFGLMVNGGAVDDSVTNTFEAGVAHMVSATGVAGYQASVWGDDCAPDGTITLSLGQDAVCTISHNDISPTIKVVKAITNDNGGTVIDPNAFGLKVNDSIVLDGVANPFDAGVAHTVSEVGLPFYEAGDWGTDCATDGTITLALDEHKTCTITNDDQDATSLTLVKQVINLDGGTAVAADWILTATGPKGFSGNGPSVSNNTNFSAGTYVLSEAIDPGSLIDPAGYSASNWVCTGTGTQLDGNTISLALGDVATCTITNDDITPTLTVFKNITNNSGGTETNENAFGLKVDDGNVLHGVTNTFDAGPHTVSELGLPGYQGGSWSGACAADGSVTLELAQQATCTITNNDISPTITVVNAVTSDNGGTVNDANAFGLKVGVVGVSDGVANSFDAGVVHTVSATGVTGYQASTWGGDCAPDGSITLALDEDAECTISHDDISPTITVVKTVVNDNGGNVFDPNAFKLRVNGSIVLDSAMNSYDAGVLHNVSEDGLNFYQAGSWGGDCAANGSITLELAENATCTITNDDTDETSLTLKKTVINDNGGGATESEWTLFAAGPTPFDGPGPSISNGANFSAGMYTLSESAGPDGYAASDWVCTGTGTQIDGNTINLELGDVAECTITNNDITPTLTVFKNIITNSGGTETNPNAFALKVDATDVLHGVTNTFDAGSHTVSEVGLPGYQAGSWTGACAADGSVTLELAQQAACTITNNDISPTITVVNTVTSDNGGTVDDPDAYGLMVDDGPVFDSVPKAFDAGIHTVSQTGVDGYQAGLWGGDCALDGSITLELDQDAVCTITNNDITPTITVVKTITNNNGGTIDDPNAFGLSVDGNIVLHNATNPFDAGVVHTVSEDGLDFYQAGSWSGDCAANGSITLELAEDATCSINNNDTDETRLTLVKQVINNNGGTSPASAWTLIATGPKGFSGSGPSVSNNANFSAGIYNLSESGGPGGYIASSWVCVGGTQLDGDTISLALGDEATCTITNDDITPTLKVVKNIINNSGGTITNHNVFGLKVDGGAVLHNTVNPFNAGSHSVSEDGLPEYRAGNWSGDCAANGSITLALGQQATCTITNNDISPTLTVINTIINDNGGTVIFPNAFGLKVDGGNVSDSVSNAFNAGSHIVSQNGVNGYQAGSWGGDCAPDGSITLALNQDAICTITNDDISPTLTVVKTVINDHGGSVTDENIFGLKVDGDTVLHNVTNEFDAGSYTVSETGLSGYQPGAWSGACAADGTLTLALGQNAICRITNNDIAPTLKVVKTIVNDNGGTITNRNAFGLKVDGNVVSHNVTNTFNAGNHTVSEDGKPEYEAGNWGGDCNPDGSITLVLAQVATCTITNDDIPPKLIVINSIINDNGGTVNDENAFGLKVDGGVVMNNVANEFSVGSHTVSQVGVSGYEAGTWGGDCNPDGSITLALNENKTCTITNNDITATLKVVKTITNDNGGTVTNRNAFGLKVDGNIVLHNAINSIDAGNHTVSEDGLPGYVPGDWSGDCNPDGTITLALGQEATCTINNDDTDNTSLTLVKKVINDNGGAAAASAWTLSADGPTGFSGKGPNVSNGDGFAAGTYKLSESDGAAGYAASNWVCAGGTQVDGDTVTLALGEAAICTITNDDITPTLKVVKFVVNDNGGKVTNRNAFGLKVDGNVVLHNAINNFDAGDHTVSEDGLPGYVASIWRGDCAPDGSITLALGQDAICRITNNDSDSTSLTLIKKVVNKGSGTASPSAWALSATGPSSFSGKGPTVSSDDGLDAGTYDLSESGGPPGYTASDWVCVGGTQDDGDTITLEPGENATCTITNTDANVGEVIFKDGFE